MEKTQKKRLKRYLLWGGAAVLVAVLALMPLLAKNSGTSDGPTASVLTTTVETGTISSSLRGGGTITVDGAEDVTIPSGVKITEFLVKNGDYVTEGTPVANVDKVSVMTAITELNDTLDYLREELEDARNEKVSAYVTATAGGRVKKVFAQAGDSVQDVMLRDGALAILSLDGKMAVKLEKRLAITTGETVTVTLADGEEAEGRVESNLDGVVVITVEDDGYEVGQTVTVSQNGETLGKSSLYIHNAWKATAYSGTIETVSAKEEKTLSSGAILFTLKDRDFDGELQHRANQHREYEELLQKLLTMYETGVLTAPCDGEISGVDSDSAHLLASTEDGWVLTPLNSNEQTFSVVLLSNVKSVEESAKTCTGKADCPLSPEEHGEDAECLSLCTTKEGCTSKLHKDTCITRCTHADSPENCTAINHYKDCIKACIHATEEGKCPSTKHYLTCIESCISSDGTKDCTATGTHKTTCIKSCTHADDAAGCPSTKYHYADCVKNCINSTSVDTICTSGKHLISCYYYGVTYTATACKLEAVGSTELIVKPDTSGKVYNVTYGLTGWTIVDDTLTTTTLIGDSQTLSAANVSAFTGKEGAVLLVITGHKGTETINIGPVVYSVATTDDSTNLPDSSDTSGMTGGMDMSSMIGGLSGFGSYSGTYTTQTEDLFDLDGETLLTVTPRDTVTLSISIDEHDISKVQLGQKATVKVAALKGQEYEAEVTAIAVSGTNNGGSSKFSVELTFAMDEQLLSGMSASAVIPQESREGLRIPAAALCQEGAKLYVYTALDDNGQPASPVEVETGLSDGEYVEILSGLEEGQQVYYSYYDTLELDTSAKADKYTFG